jgi:hypothetical protein
LLNPEINGSALLIGAGMSNGIAPQVTELTEEIRHRHNTILQQLGINIPAPTGKDFYDWAELALNEIKTTHHLTDSEAKLRLADAMGITTDTRFHANKGMPLRGNTPRHRVIARFAREGRWSIICSLNWDCILETALNSVGLQSHPNPNIVHSNPLPWKKWYCTWQAGDQHNPTPLKNCTVHIIKPHGCVNKLATRDAASFIVTRAEINNLPNNLGVTVAGRMNIMFSDVQLITIGWRAEEDYIHKNIEGIRNMGTLLQHGPDRLSIINRTWYPDPHVSPPVMHDKVASAFNTDRDNSHFAVGNPNQPTIDELPLWLQTRYGLERLEQFSTATNHPDWNAKTQLLQTIKNQFPEPKPTDWLNSFFDDFLAVWVRLCCNAGKVVYIKNAPIHPDIIATHRRDDHIPWGYAQSNREDLLAVIPLILSLRGAPPTNTTTKWNFGEFPGALWDEANGHLVLPLPAWGNNMPIELAAIKPLVDGWSWSRKGIIYKVSILPLQPQPDYVPADDDNFILRSSIAQVMKSSRFSTPHDIGIVTLADM